MNKVNIKDKTFELYIEEEKIQDRVKQLAHRINSELEGKDVVILGILNGAYMFAADLSKHITIPCRVSFLKMASYEGTESTGKVKRLIGINEILENKTLLVVEDIVDTGITLHKIRKQLEGFEPQEVLVATLLYKPEANLKDYKPQYIGFEIPNTFVLGYGLDYDGYGRNLKHIYTLAN
jgi:hypoxanthine phosphoribosyltransferase